MAVNIFSAHCRHEASFSFKNGLDPSYGNYMHCFTAPVLYDEILSNGESATDELRIDLQDAIATNCPHLQYTRCLLQDRYFFLSPKSSPKMDVEQQCISIGYVFSGASLTNRHLVFVTCHVYSGCSCHVRVVGMHMVPQSSPGLRVKEPHDPTP